MSEVEFAGFGRRLTAAVLDSLVWLIGLLWFFGAFPADFFDHHPVAAGAIVIVAFSLWFNYFAICEWRFGQTIGKNALGVRVVPVDAGATLTYNAAAIRNLLRIVDFPLTLVGVDYLIVRGSARRQRLGDRAARTVVLRESPPSPPPPPRRDAVAGPTAGELFSDASEALGQVSPPVPAPPPEPAGPDEGTEPPQSSAASDAGGREFPPATWGARRALGGTAIGLLIGVLLVPLVALPIDPDLSAFGGDGREMVTLDGRAGRMVGVAGEGTGAIVAVQMEDGRLQLVGLSGVGGPDRDLGSDGVKLGDAPLGFTPRAVAVDSGDRILVAGDAARDVVVERYGSDGDLDRSFAGHGRLEIADPRPRVLAVAALPDDRLSLVVASHARRRLAVVDLDGAEVGSRRPLRPPAAGASAAAAGSAEDGSIAVPYLGPEVVGKYLPSGAPDFGFGSRGVAPLDLGDTRISSATVRSGADGGGVFVAGLSGSATVIAELDSDGTPDSGFGTDGVERRRIFATPGPPAVAPADDDKVFVAQLDPSSGSGSSRVSVARLEKGGGLDGGVVAILLAQGLLALTLIATATKTALPGGATLPGGSLRTAAGRLGIRRPRPKWGRLTVLALLVYYAIAIAYALLVVQPEQEDIARSLGLGSGVLTTLLAVFLIALAAPVSEEIFFRGMLFGGLRRNMGRLPAAAVSALVFGALHATTGVTAVPPLIVFGFVLALLYERTGSLLPGMLGHAINNGLALALAT